MAFDVRIGGPDFLLKENVAAFIRIEESIRQYAAHSREPIFLIRRPFQLPEDHLALLWTRGVAIVGCYPFGGAIHASAQEEWSAERLDADHPQIVARQRASDEWVFANPYDSLSQALPEFADILEKETPPPVTVAILTGNATSLEFNGPSRNESQFRVMTADFAVSRTIVHLPNILRAADVGRVLFTNAELESIAMRLERSAQERLASQRSAPARGNEPMSGRRQAVRQFRKRTPWIVASIILALIFIFFIGRVAFAPKPVSTLGIASMTSAPRHPPSEMIIELPVESELVISPMLYRTRVDFDRALSRGDGLRFLPDTQQVIYLDSAQFAKGVYGYFRIDNNWRKGKLLQTLEPIDTVTIVTFLDPLP